MVQTRLLQTTLTPPSCIEGGLFACPWIRVLKRWGNSWEGQRCEGRRVHHSAACRSRRHSPLREDSDHFPLGRFKASYNHYYFTLHIIPVKWVSIGCGFLADGATKHEKSGQRQPRQKAEDKMGFWTPNIRADITTHPHLLWTADVDEGLKLGEDESMNSSC